MGASAGGISAIQIIFSNLPNDFQLPILVTQHLPSHAEIDVQLVFARSGKTNVMEAEDKMPIEPGHIYFAPSDYHMLVESDDTISLSQDAPVHFARPSIDVLFESAAQALRKRCVGVLLTGANCDGAEGLNMVKDLGGLTIVQDPLSAEMPTMPESALNRFQPDYICNLGEISKRLILLSEVDRAAKS